MSDGQPPGYIGWPKGGRAGKQGAATPRDQFRHNLARLMSERGMTQAALARAMQVSRVAVHAWIWGTCFPETARLLKLAQALNVPVGELLEADQSSSQASNEEALLLDAFRKLPNTARLTLLAGAYELSAQFADKALEAAEPAPLISA